MFLLLEPNMVISVAIGCIGIPAWYACTVWALERVRP